MPAQKSFKNDKTLFLGLSDETEYYNEKIKKRVSSWSNFLMTVIDPTKEEKWRREFCSNVV